MNNLIVSRFSGNDAANSERVRNAAAIVKANPARRFVVVSAPGATPDSVGITDLLYMCHASFQNKENYLDTLTKIAERYREIINGLGISFDLDAEIDALRQALEAGKNLDYIGSRGEYIMAKIMAEYLGWKFVDAAQIIFFRGDGSPDTAKTFRIAGDILNGCERAVIPSFYGTAPDGSIKTFTRGDCDTAGAMTACSVDAGLFEKWSENAKICSADPEVIPDSEIIRHITYAEALEMNFIGFNIIKDCDIFMLDEKKISMRICSSDDPEDGGMLISHKLPQGLKRQLTACIAGRSNFTVLHINKYGMNKMYDIPEKLFAVFARHRIACQHYLAGIHRMAVILKSPAFDLRRGQILSDIEKAVAPDSMSVEKDLSLIAVVGEGMGTVKGIFGRIFNALAGAGIKAKMIEHGSDDLNIILGVHDSNYPGAIKALYRSIVMNKEA